MKTKPKPPESEPLTSIFSEGIRTSPYFNPSRPTKGVPFVEDRLSSLDLYIECLEDAVRRLEKRLSPILREIPEEPSRVPKFPRPPVPLARTIEDMADRIYQLHAKLIRLQLRVEL